jgi:uncharacterized protein (DUF983 family)
MAKAKNNLLTILTNKCPNCREGNLFVQPSAYKQGMAEMNKSCPVCGENLQREPGFYFGAAYVSYGLTVAIWVALFVALTVFDAIGLISFSIGEDPLLFIITGVILLLILLPLIYRLSRSIWINMFVKRKDVHLKDEA